MRLVAKLGDADTEGHSIVQGSDNVFVENVAVARFGDVDSNGDSNTDGSMNVFVNGVPIYRERDRDTAKDPQVGSSSTVYAMSDSTEVLETYAVLEATTQPGVSLENAALQHADDPGSDPRYDYARRAIDDKNANFTAQDEKVGDDEDTAPQPPPPQVPSDCTDIMSQSSFSGSFQLSPNFTLAQLTTNTLVSNYILKAQGGLSQQQIVCNLRALCVNVLEPMKAKYGNAMKINSGFRHGSGTSQHYKGQAADVSFVGLEGTTANFTRAQDIKDSFIYDQYIFEQNNSIWHHVSYTTTTNRRMVLTKPRGNTYHAGLRTVTA